MAHNPPNMTVTLTWCGDAKRWRVDWRVAIGRAVRSGWKYVETQEPVGEIEARRIVAAIQREMDAWLPLYGATADR